MQRPSRVLLISSCAMRALFFFLRAPYRVFFCNSSCAKSCPKWCYCYRPWARHKICQWYVAKFDTQWSSRTSTPIVNQRMLAKTPVMEQVRAAGLWQTCCCGSPKAALVWDAIGISTFQECESGMFHEWSNEESSASDRQWSTVHRKSWWPVRKSLAPG